MEKVGESVRGQDREIREQKTRTWLALKRWLSRKEESERVNLKLERKRLGEIIKKKKEEINEKKWKRVESSKGLTEFWKAVGAYRKKKKKKGNNIAKEEWFRHFKKLLGVKEEDRGRWERRRRV